MRRREIVIRRRGVVIKLGRELFRVQVGVEGVWHSES